MAAFITYDVPWSGWRRFGYSGPDQAGQDGSYEVLSQTIKGLALHSARHRHRQAEELQRGKS